MPPIPEGVVFHAEFTTSQGKLLLNKEPFQVMGVNWFGFEGTWNVAFGVDRRSQDSILKQIVEEGINTLRIPVAVESVLNPSQYLTDPWAIDGELNPHLAAAANNYLDLLESFIDRSASWGVFTLLDMHA